MTDHNIEEESNNKQVQTRLHVFPHVLEENERAGVFSDHQCQTAVTSFPITENTTILCSLLEFIPYQDIQEECLRELELPRKPRLQWRLPTESETELRSCSSSITAREYKSALRRVQLTDEVLEEDSISGSFAAFSQFHQKQKKETCDQNIQTDISVTPHILENDEIANVTLEETTQTPFTFSPSDSFGGVFSKLKASATHFIGVLSSEAIPSSSKNNQTEATDILSEPNIAVEDQIKHVIDVTVSTLQNELAKLVTMFPLKDPNCKCVENFYEKNSQKNLYQCNCVPKQLPTCTPAVSKNSVGKVEEDKKNLQHQIKKMEPSDSSVKKNVKESPKKTTSTTKELTSNVAKVNVLKANEIARTLPKNKEQNNPPKGENGLKQLLQSSNVRNCLQEEQMANVNNTIPSCSLPKEKMGDHLQNKRRTPNISCECHPCESGAAPPVLCSRESIRNNEEKNTQESKMNKLAALPIETTISCPIVQIEREQVPNNIRLTVSLPDLTERVIRLSMINQKYALNDQNIARAKVGLSKPSVDCGKNSFSNNPTRTSSTLHHTTPDKISLQIFIRPRVRLNKTYFVRRTKGNSITQNDSFSIHKLNKTTRKTDECNFKGVNNNQLGINASNKESHGQLKASSNQLRTINKLTFLNAQQTENSGHNIFINLRWVRSEEEINYQPKVTVSETFGKESKDKFKMEEEELIENEKSSSILYDHENTYSEPYMDELNDTTIAVQTDLEMTDQLESASLNSLPSIPEDSIECACNSNPEMPWQKISLPKPGTYIIAPSSKKDIHEEDETIEDTEAPEKEEDETQEEEAAEEETAEDEADEEPEFEAEAEAEEEPEGEEDEEQLEAEAEPPAEPVADNFITSSQKFAYDPPVKRYNEPYMDNLYRMFPDEEDLIECDSHTEIPWKDIILPTNCKIRKLRKPKPDDGLTGLFIPSNKPPNLNEEDLIEIEISFPEKTSEMVPIQGGAGSQATVSVCSSISGQKPKRCPKEFVLQVEVAKSSAHSVSFKSHKSSTAKSIPIGTSLHATCSQPFDVTTATDEKSSVIINIKRSTECPYKSEYIPVEATQRNSKLLAVVNPHTPTGKAPTKVKSCSATDVNKSGNVTPKSSGRIIKKSSVSMPDIPSKNTIKAKISYKKLGEEEKVITKEMGIEPGVSILEMQVPDTPMLVKMKVTSKGPSCAPKEVFTPGKCDCKNSVKPDSFKPDPVMAALDTCETEMRPLRQALTQLQQKIRSLNMPEMKGCMCATALKPGLDAPTNLPTVHSKVMIQGNVPGAVTKTRIKMHPNMPLTSNTCDYYQAPTLQRPPPAAPYYNYPPLVMPPARLPAYMPQDSNYLPTNRQSGMQQYQQPYDPYMESHQSPGGRNNNPCACRTGQRSSGYSAAGRDDMAMQARHYGMSPDYRGRNYPDQEAAYHNFPETPQYQLQSVLSSREFNDGHSDYNIPSGTESETGGEFVCPFMEIVRSMSNQSKTKTEKKSKKKRKKSKQNERGSVCTPCGQQSDDEEYRNGKSLKTDPQSFTPPSAKSNDVSRDKDKSGNKTIRSKTVVKMHPF